MSGPFDPAPPGEPRLRVEDILESIPDVVYTLDMGLRLLRWNRRLELVTGRAFAELEGLPAIELIHEEDRPGVAAAIEEAFANGYAEREGRLLSRHGVPVPYHLTGVPLKDASGQVIGLVGSGRDIRERRRAEQALAAERERLAVTLRNIGDGVIAIDRQQRVVLLNQLAEKLLGVAGADVLGTELPLLLRRLGGDAADVLQRCKDGLAHDVEFGPRHRVLEVRMNPVEEGPEAGGSVLLLRDVTEDRHAQKSMEQQGRLAAVGQLAAGIAHDFNNILTVVVGVAERLKLEPRLRRPVREKLELVAQQGQRASHLIRQIMDFSRRSNADRHPIDLVPVVEDTIKLLQRAIPENVVVEARYEVASIAAPANATQIQQVLTNLALNARDAMPAGGRLEISLRARALLPGEPPPVPGMSPGEWVEITVSDTGRGIPPELLAHVFEPFFTTKQPGEGTGLGLAQVYGLVRQHDGFIDVASELGAGCIFFIYLPRAAEPLPLQPDVDREPLRGGGETILLVEDEPPVRDVITWELSGMGYRVLPASRGEEALDIYDAERSVVALVILDLLMPGIGGLELYRLLRGRDPQLPIIVLSGYSPEVGAAGTEIGIDAGVLWLQKPASLDQLNATVRHALRQRVAAARSGGAASAF